jgi:pyridoxal phosphate enzyme (YggS family)
LIGVGEIAEHIAALQKELPEGVTLVAVSKTKPMEAILEAYEAGQRDFGENYIQELCDKADKLPKDIRWHAIGHVQSNKVKYIAPFVHLIHGVDSLKLLQEINKQAQKNERVIDCLLQIFIATEESKFGLDATELDALLKSETFQHLQNIRIVGLMGMASNTENEAQIRSEFKGLRDLFLSMQKDYPDFQHLSMGMSGDYSIAIAEGSTMIRVGSLIFGTRQYSKP